MLVLLDGRAVFLEVKKPNGRASKIQLYTHEQIRKRGIACEVVRTVPEAMGAVEKATSVRVIL